MTALYAAADALLLPSEGEPFALSILEAMTAGLPIVSVNSGGTPEMFREEGIGFLEEPADASAIGCALKGA